MPTRILIAPGIAEPNIIPGRGQRQPDGFVIIIQYPTVCRIKLTMLDIDHWQSIYEIFSILLSLDSVESQDVRVLCYHFIVFVGPFFLFH